jgi:hypothetical protein
MLFPIFRKSLDVDEDFATNKISYLGMELFFSVFSSFDV